MDGFDSALRLEVQARERLEALVAPLSVVFLPGVVRAYGAV